MNRNHRLLSLLVICGLALAASSGQMSSATNADESAIRSADAQWSKAASAKDLDRTVSFYAPDAVEMPPNVAALVGREAIRTIWNEEFKDPAFSPSWQVKVIEVSRSGDLGYVRGTYEAFYTAAGARVRDHGKFLTIWKKQPDGAWRVAVDTYNSDAPVMFPLGGGAGVPGGIPGVPGGVVGGIPAGAPIDTPGGVVGGVGNASPPPPPPPPARENAPPPTVRVSQGVMAGLLIHKVEPVYPLLAKQARIVGAVTLAALVGKDGSVENLKVVSGHPLLVEAAVDAVKQWRYKPYLLNGEPVNVQGTITVIFKLQEKNP